MNAITIFRQTSNSRDTLDLILEKLMSIFKASEVYCDDFNPEWMTQGELNLKRLHSLVDRLEAPRGKVTFEVTGNVVARENEKIQCTERSIILYVWCVSHRRLWGEKNWCHQLTNVIQELFGHLASRGVSSQQSQVNFSCHAAVDQMFLLRTANWPGRG